MKKRLFAISLILILIVVLCGCNEETPEPKKQASSELYESFLSGEAKVFGDKYEPTIWFGDEEENIVNDNSGFTISQLVGRFMTTDLSTTGGDLGTVKYCYIDCGNDEEEELAIEISVVEDETTYTRQVLIKNFDGKLQVCNVLESIYRYETKLKGTSGLAILSGGSSASSYDYSVYAFDKDGVLHTICYEEGNFEMGAYYPEGNAVSAVAAEYMESIPEEYLLRIVHFFGEDGEADATVYGADPEDDSLVKQIFDEAKATLTPSEEIDKMIIDRLDGYGITELTDDEPEWTDLDMEKAGLKELVDYGYNAVFVSNTDEFVKAIKDDTTIVLAPGTYNVTEWLDEHFEEIEYFYLEQYEPKGVCYYAMDEEMEFIISQLSSLKIISQDKDNPATIVSVPRYYNVLSFKNCNSVRIENVVVGHTEEGVCSGDVLGFTDCMSSKVLGCDLYGCGAFGLNLDGSYVSCNDSVIHDCSYGCIEMYDNSYISFENTTFRDCREYTMFDIVDSMAYFYNCTFDNLQGDMIYMTEDSDVTFSNCKFDKNSLNGFEAYNGPGLLTINS